MTEEEHGRGAPARAARDRRVPRRRLRAAAGAVATSSSHEMMAFLACRAGRPTTSCRCSSRTCTSTAPTPRAITWGDEIPDDVRADAHVVVIGCGESGHPRRHPPGAGRAAVHDRREERRARAARGGRTATRARASTSAATSTATRSSPADHWTEYFSQQPELRDYFERVLEQVRPRAALPLRHARSTPRPTTTRPVGGRSTVTQPRRQHRDARRAVRHQRGRLAELTAAARHPGHGRRSPGRRSTRPAGTTPSTTRASGSRSIGAGASGFQIAPTIADEVEQLTVYQRTAQWMFPNPNYHRAVPDGERWAMRHLPFYGRWFRFLTFYPGRRAHRSSAHRIDPDYDDGGLADQRGERGDARAVRRAGSRAQLGDDAELEAKVMPDYPATAKRMLQDNGSWLACLRKANVELVRTRHRAHRRRRRRHRRRHLPPRRRHLLRHRLPAQRLPLADGRSPAATAWCCATQWGDEPTAYLGITVHELPEPVLPLRPGHEPRPRREPDLPVRVPGRLRDGGAPRAARRRAPHARAAPEVHDEYADALPRARSRRWCGRTRR